MGFPSPFIDQEGRERVHVFVVFVAKCTVRPCRALCERESRLPTPADDMAVADVMSFLLMTAHGVEGSDLRTASRSSLRSFLRGSPSRMVACPRRAKSKEWLAHMALRSPLLRVDLTGVFSGAWVVTWRKSRASFPVWLTRARSTGSSLPNLERDGNHPLEGERLPRGRRASSVTDIPVRGRPSTSSRTGAEEFCDGGPLRGKLLTKKQDYWSFGVSPPEQKDKLAPLIEALQRLSRHGLTAGGVIANFHRRRVLPLMRRRLPLFRMTTGADVTGTAMAAEPLPVTTAVQRARRAIDKLPDDPWVVPMRPEDGHLSFGLSRSHYSKPPVPEDKAVNRALAKRAKVDKDRREARRKRKDRKRKKHLAENREREEQGLSPLPTPESSPDPDGSEEDGGARSPSPLELPVSSRAPPSGATQAAASAGGSGEIVDLETPPSTVVPTSGSPSGAATAALEEPQGRGEAPERPSAVEEAPARGPGVEVPQEASRVTPQGEADASTGGEASRVAPQGEAGASTGGEVPVVAPASTSRPKRKLPIVRVPSLAPTKALKVGPSSSPHPSSQLLGPTNEVVQDFVTFFDAQAELQVKQQPCEEAPWVLEEPRPPQLLEGAVEPRAEVARSEDATPAPREALRVEEPPAAPVEADAAVAPPHEGGEGRTLGGGFPHLKELAEALGVGAPVTQGRESGGAAPSTLIVAPPGPASAGSCGTHARGSAEVWQSRRELPEQFVGEAVAEERLWDVQSSHGQDVRRALRDILRLHDEAGKIHQELRHQAFAKNDQIAALLLELRRLSGAVETRDHQLDDLRGARDRAVAECRQKGEVITRLDGSVSALREQLANSSTWLDSERPARSAAESAVEEERRLVVETRDQLELEQAARAAAERQAREGEKALEAAHGQVEALKQALQAETESKEAVLVAHSATQRELDELVQAASVACNEIAGADVQSGSSLASRLRALGGHFTSRVKEALLLGARKALGVVTTHYQADLSKLAAGYVVADDLNDEEAVAAMEEADAAADGTTRVLAGHFEGVLFPGEDGGDWDDLGGGGDP
nr:unnamed protein product [Digitaria exilis]